MYPHQITVRGELIWNNVVIAAVPIVDGSVSGDRQSVVRRTLNAEVDPRMAPTSLQDQLTPYGAFIRVFRGIRYPNGFVQEYPVFSGRVDSVDFGREHSVVAASDLGAFVSDARFEKPYTATRNLTIVDQMKAIITDAYAAATFTINASSAGKITTPATWDRERAEALDNLAGTISAEWYASADGTFHIDPIAALSVSQALWIVDAGDTGVAISHSTQLDRQAVYNAVVVNGEPPDGQVPAYGVARDTDPNSLTRWGGPFGKVPKFFSSQFITTNAQAQAVAASMLVDAVSSSRAVSVTCVPNPRIRVGDVIYVTERLGSDWDGMYFVNSLTMPLGPDSVMSMVCKMAADAIPGDDAESVLITPRPASFVEGVSLGDPTG
jgi:hypothetical protein